MAETNFTLYTKEGYQQLVDELAYLKDVRVPEIKVQLAVLRKFQSPNIGFCYDSCHHTNYAPDVDLLSLYGNRLFALHLHDNGGIHNQHQLPFDGSINWNETMNRISLTGYKGATT